jgi:hypothetical protein
VILVVFFFTSFGCKIIKVEMFVFAYCLLGLTATIHQWSKRMLKNFSTCIVKKDTEDSELFQINVYE